MNSFARDERGIAVLWVAISIAIIVGSAVLAIDLSAIQTTKTQLQNAADAACLAAARELVPDGTTSLAERRQNATNTAIAIAALNNAFIDRGVGPVNITAADVTFPSDERVTVRTHRTEATQDPLRTYFVAALRPMGSNLADVSADATAEALPASGTLDFFPWTVPDRFQDNDGDAKWDDQEPFTDTNGNGVWDPGENWDDVDKDGVYDEGDWYDYLLTGYGTAPPSPFRDAGLQLALKVGDSADAQTSGFFFPARWPPMNYRTGEIPGAGASVYRDYIVNKAPYWVSVGDVLHLEFGKMEGPTNQGVNDILNACPTSSFDMATGQVINHSHPMTVECPRIGAIAFYDPSDARVSSDKLVTIVKISHWFVESKGAPKGTVYGRLIEIADPNAIPGSGFGGGFVYATRLVE
jgi:Flp pilus assembly protein TadG